MYIKDTGQNTNSSKNVAHWGQCCTLGGCTLGASGVLRELKYFENARDLIEIFPIQLVSRSHAMTCYAPWRYSLRGEDHSSAKLVHRQVK